MEILRSLGYFILLLGGLIFFHELGHFLLCKLLGVRVLVFSLGFGPALVARRWGDTVYQIAILPIGGYVRMFGDEPDSTVPEEARRVAFNYRPLWRRSLIVLAGPVFNLVLPFIVFFGMFLLPAEMPPSYIGTVTPGGPAWNAGIQPGDTITAIDHEKVDYWWQVEDAIAAAPDRQLAVELRRGERTIKTAVTPDGVEQVLIPQMDVRERRGVIGIAYVFKRPMVWVAPGSAAEAAGLRSWDWVAAVDGRPVESFEALEAALLGAGPFALQVLRQVPLGRVGHGEVAGYGEPLTVVLPAADPAVLLAEWVAAEVVRLPVPLVVALQPFRLLREPAGLAARLAAPCQICAAEFAVHSVVPGTPAEALGLGPGDRILTVDGETFPLWSTLEERIARDLASEHEIAWVGASGRQTAAFSFVATTRTGEFGEERKEVVFGAHNHAASGSPDLLPNRMRLTFAARETWKETIKAYRLTLMSLAGLLVGKVPAKELGGPILMYQMASKTEVYGWDWFFAVMVWLSIGLGFLNLLPIPIMDGGHLVFFAIEAVMRRPVPMRVRQVAAWVGIAIIAALMILVFFNDITRNWDAIKGWF